MSTKVTINVSALKKVSGWLKRLRHRQHFDMDSWADRNDCGTSYCIAGKALVDAGLMHWPKGEDFPRYLHPVTGKRTNPFTAARALLGLTPQQAKSMFYGDHYDPKDAAAYIDNFLRENK